MWHTQTGKRVRHRIDGLEISAAAIVLGLLVRHRIDGLEKKGKLVIAKR